MTVIKIPSDSPINVQNAFRDVERSIRDLTQRFDNLKQGATQDDVAQLRKEFARALRNPSFRTWVDVFGSNMAPLASTAEYVVGSDGSTVKFLDRRVVQLPANFNTSSATLADVTGLSFTVEAAAVYAFEFMIHWNSAANTTGINLSINGPSSPVLIHFERRIQTVAGVQEDWQLAYDAGAASPDFDTLKAAYWAQIKGKIRNVNAGTLVVRAATEVAASQVTVQTRSSGWIHRLI